MLLPVINESDSPAISLRGSRFSNTIVIFIECKLSQGAILERNLLIATHALLLTNMCNFHARHPSPQPPRRLFR